MQNSKDHRFFRWWEDQRKGGVALYVLLYTFVWTVIIFLSLIFIPLALDFFFSLRVNYFLHLDELPYWLQLLLSLAAGLALSLFQWQKNETRWSKLKHAVKDFTEENVP